MGNLSVIRDLANPQKYDGGIGLECDPLLVFEEMIEEPSVHWGRYVAYIVWVHEKFGLDCMRHVLRALEKEHPQYLTPIWALMVRWLRLRCSRD